MKNMIMTIVLLASNNALLFSASSGQNLLQNVSVNGVVNDEVFELAPEQICKILPANCVKIEKYVLAAIFLSSRDCGFHSSIQYSKNDRQVTVIVNKDKEDKAGFKIKYLSDEGAMVLCQLLNRYDEKSHDDTSYRAVRDLKVELGIIDFTLEALRGKISTLTDAYPVA